MKINIIISSNCIQYYFYMQKETCIKKSPKPIFNSVLYLEPLDYSSDQSEHDYSSDSETKSNSFSGNSSSSSSTEKNQVDKNLQSCLLPGFLKRLDQCSPVSVKVSPCLANGKERGPDHGWRCQEIGWKKLNFYEEEEKTVYNSKVLDLNFKNKKNQGDLLEQNFSEKEYEFVLVKKKTSESKFPKKTKFEKLNTGKKKKYKRQFNEREGDWFCSQCRNINFSFRTRCNICKLSKMKSEIVYEQKELEYFGKGQNE